MDEIQILKEKAKFFKDKNIVVHIQQMSPTIKLMRFYNGPITSIEDDFLVINDEVLGELPIYFIELKTIEPRKEEI